MKNILLGNHNASVCLIQAVDEHDAATLQQEYDLIQQSTKGAQILLAAFQVDDWNRDLSPWEAPPVFGDEAFGDDATRTLSYVAKKLIPSLKENGLVRDDTKYLIGGYSLSAFFALWVCCQTNFFSGCAAASPSVWFPGWMEYAEKNMLKTKNVYLSLGDKEEKTKHPVMATVGDHIRKMEEIYKAAGMDCTLEWNKGNHFKDADVRTAKAFAHVVGRI